MNSGYSKSKIFMRDTTETSVSDHVTEIILLWKSPNAFDQILIRVPVSSQNLSHWRDDLK